MNKPTLANAQLLRSARKAKGISQSCVAKSAGISQPFYAYVESGKRDPSVAVAKRIAEVLEIPWSSVFEKE